MRSLSAMDRGFAPASLAYAGALSLREAEGLRVKIRPRARKSRFGLRDRILARLAGPGVSAIFAGAVLLSTGVYGAVKGGHYEAFKAAQGAPADIIAKAFGFGIEAVTIAGESELAESDILAAADIGPRNSLLFLDVASVRERLQALPLVKDVSVTKLYPDRLLIEVEERQPSALWQKNGHVDIIAADGMPLDAMRDQRFIHLPLVVGAGANERLGEYLALLEAAGDQRDKIRAGVLIAQRRWTLKMTNGIDVLLPEREPAAALASFIQLQRDSHILDKDVLSFDLRQPGRVVARLTEDAAAARAESTAHKTKSKGGPT
ncbi:FtsQ-type POTRA domain-containing protein [Methylocapsa polymorpha]|uniref:Cell division protein FtsQ n=1 Tax=Methylocapsa polymorpha TaxID=3080828 RepID=A0ABZ0HNP6_9HYPH|nr:FtsQ-type POTRA domain-containing protein [Methylocapsa sp. RX1]